MKSTETARRIPAKQQRILMSLRSRIVEGHWQPGQQISPRRELEQSFGVSPPTLQRAVDHLVRDGFLSPVAGVGTFVADQLPFLTHYGLVFPCPDNGCNWLRFWVALKNEAERLNLADGRKMPVYYGEEGYSGGKERVRLLRHIRDHRLAGLIFVSPLAAYRNTPVLDLPDLPRVSISVPEGDNVPRVVFSGLEERALDYLAARGRRRVALITSASVIAQTDRVQRWFDGAAARGMESPAHWVQGLDIHFPQTARALVQLLMRGKDTERPDGLLIGDDNLVEYATAGLIDAGIKVPADVEVVAHCNFPWPTPSVLPAKRLGYDARECLRHCIELIDTQRRSGQPSALTVIPARFEEEISGGTPG